MSDRDSERPSCNVQCPTCLAEPGQACRTRATRRVTDTHAARFERAYGAAQAMTRDAIREGDIVRVRGLDGVEHEAIADGGVENGQVWVRFTTKGRATPVPAKYVTKERNAW